MADAKTEKQKVKEITDKLEEGLKELFESGKYKNYLSTMSKFHNYSVNNTLLIALQRPDASLVAGYQAWQKNFNRHVNKGEKGIRILAPAPYKIKEERDKLDPVTGEIMLDHFPISSTFILTVATILPSFISCRPTSWPSVPRSTISPVRPTASMAFATPIAISSLPQKITSTSG